MSVAEGSVWPKVLASFAAGIICMSLVSENKATTAAKAPENGAVRVAEPAREPDKPIIAAEPARLPVPPAVPASAATPAPVAAPASARVAFACGPDNPPLAGGECGSPPQSRSDGRPIRVITTDKVAAAAAAATAGPVTKKAPARKAAQDLIGPPPEAVEDTASLAQAPSPPAAASLPAPAVEAKALASPEVAAAMASSGSVADNPAAPAPVASLAPDAKPDPKASSEAEAATSTAAPTVADTVRTVRDRRRPTSRRHARSDEAQPLTRTQRRAAQRREAYERDLEAGRIRAIRLSNGRVVEIRLSRREMRGYEDDDPPPSYRRYRRRSDSVMTWLGSPYY